MHTEGMHYDDEKYEAKSMSDGLSNWIAEFPPSISIPPTSTNYSNGNLNFDIDTSQDWNRNRNRNINKFRNTFDGFDLAKYNSKSIIRNIGGGRGKAKARRRPPTIEESMLIPRLTRSQSLPSSPSSLSPNQNRMRPRGTRARRLRRSGVHGKSCQTVLFFLCVFFCFVLFYGIV